MNELKEINEMLEPKETKSATISWRVQPSLKNALKKYANEQDITMQQLLGDAVKIYVNQKSAELKLN